MSNSFEPDEAAHFVGPDLGPKCLLRLSKYICKATHIKGTKDQAILYIVFGINNFYNCRILEHTYIYRKFHQLIFGYKIDIE